MNVSTTVLRTAPSVMTRPDRNTPCAGGSGQTLTPVGWQAVALLTLLAALLRLHDIGQNPFWRNELFSLYWSRHSIGFLLSRGLFVETNPPLHFVLLKLWIMLFGTGEFAVRSLSALASIGSVPLIYLLGRDLGGAKVGLLAALLLAVSPVQIFLAQEARVYALLPLFVMALMLAAGRFLRACETPVGRAGGHAGGKALMLYGAAGTALLYSHAIGAFLLLAIGAGMLLRLRGARATRAQILGFISTNAVIGLLALPVLIGTASQSFSPNIDWIAPLTWNTLVVVSRFLLIGPMVRGDIGVAAGATLLFAELGLSLALSLVLVVFARRAVPERGPRTLVLLFPLLFVLAVCAVSVVRPVLEPRVMAWISVPISLAMAFLLTAPETKWLRASAATLWICATVIGLCNNVVWPAQPYPDWRGFARDLAVADGAAPMLVAGPHVGALGVAWYAAHPLQEPLRQWTLTPDRKLSNTETVGQEVAGAAPITSDAIAATIRSGGHVRLFLDVNDQVKLGREIAALPGFSGASQQQYPGLVVYSW